MASERTASLTMLENQTLKSINAAGYTNCKRNGLITGTAEMRLHHLVSYTRPLSAKPMQKQCA
jgi:hypothetical protein